MFLEWLISLTSLKVKVYTITCSLQQSTRELISEAKLVCRLEVCSKVIDLTLCAFNAQVAEWLSEWLTSKRSDTNGINLRLLFYDGQATHPQFNLFTPKSTYIDISSDSEMQDDVYTIWYIEKTKGSVNLRLEICQSDAGSTEAMLRTWVQASRFGGDDASRRCQLFYQLK